MIPEAWIPCSSSLFSMGGGELYTILQREAVSAVQSKKI
jgi:hypothetical protein